MSQHKNRVVQSTKKLPSPCGVPRIVPKINDSDDEDNIYLPCDITRLTCPFSVDDIDQLHNQDQVYEFWHHKLISIFGIRGEYRRLRGNRHKVNEILELEPFGTYGVSEITLERVAEHLADCGITDEDAEECWDWAYERLKGYVQKSRAGMTLKGHDEWVALQEYLISREMYVVE